MNDRELLEEFIRVERDANQVRIFVREIHWDGPYTPLSTWVIEGDLPATATKAEANAAATDVLEDVRYFLVCRECEQRNPVGWMHNARICQACAEPNHGVVH